MSKPFASKRSIKTAFILGAGLGTRLRPLTDHCPKPLLPLGGRPMITYAMEHLRRAGIERFIVNTHHCAQVYAETFPRREWRGVPIVFRHEPTLLDTGGGIKNIEDLLVEGEPLLVYNGDVLTDMPLQDLMERHFQAGAPATLALRSDGHPRNVNLDAEGYVCDLRHTLGHDGVRSCLFTGVYIVEKSLLAGIAPGIKQDIIPVFVAMIRTRPRAVAGAVIDTGHWSDVGSPAIYRALQDL
ncbi:MAG: nucleotidyltransferase family protein [Pseudomonadota bacterium]|nr:nucleotidyltransferase family protein [Pseudomonadota bacterium]